MPPMPANTTLSAQGPPGTGKTAAIIGIISALLLAKRPTSGHKASSAAALASSQAKEALPKPSKSTKQDTGNLQILAVPLLWMISQQEISMIANNARLPFCLL